MAENEAERWTWSIGRAQRAHEVLLRLIEAFPLAEAERAPRRAVMLVDLLDAELMRGGSDAE